MRAIDERIGGSASFDSGMTKVVMYRGIRWFGAGTNGRAAWYKAGYFNIIEAAESAALPNVTPSLVSYNGTWFAWWGLTSNPNSYERVVEVTSREVGL